MCASVTSCKTSHVLVVLRPDMALIKVIIIGASCDCLINACCDGAGLGAGRPVIGQLTPLSHAASARAARAGPVTSSDILFTPEIQDGSCECLGPIAI